MDPVSAAYAAAVTAGDQVEADRLGLVLDVVTQLEQGVPMRLGEAALDHAQRGVPVFPVQPGGKRPLTSHGFKDATTDAAAVAAWWARWPDANIGIPTGQRWDVIDIDGVAGLARMYVGDPPLVDTLTVAGVALTARAGGRHLYVPVTGRGNTTGFLPGIDLRGRGGYVVAPPSIGANGRRYQWMQEPWG